MYSTLIIIGLGIIPLDRHFFLKLYITSNFILMFQNTKIYRENVFYVKIIIRYIIYIYEHWLHTIICIDSSMSFFGRS